MKFWKKLFGSTLPQALVDPFSLKLPERWEPIPYDQANGYNEELKKELCKNHRLFNVPANAIARRKDRDDFLYQIQIENEAFAVVHLTWSKESSPHWPGHTINSNFEEFTKEEIGS